MAFHFSREFIAAIRTGTLEVCAHSPKRSSMATSTDSNTTFPKSASTAPGKTIVPFHKQWGVTSYYSVKSHFGTEFQPLAPAASRSDDDPVSDSRKTEGGDRTVTLENFYQGWAHGHADSLRPVSER
jgi:hypothetical protein